jgi:hypothetical protein
MISIDFNTWNGYQFGNKLLGLNNLIQISFYYEQEYSFNNFKGLDLFKIDNQKSDSIIHGEILTSDFLIKNKDNITLDKEKNYILEPCLLELFNVYDSVSTFDIFKLKLDNIQENKVFVGIHFRGTDFKLWDEKAILSFEYYKNSIDFVINEIKNDFIFMLFTDDSDLISYNQTIDYLNKNNIDYKFGNINNFNEDFYMLSQCDYIISTPSTFCITAAFCGKKNKKIIHSYEFVVDYKNNSDYFRDKFWKYLTSTNNHKDYKLYKLI